MKVWALMHCIAYEGDRLVELYATAEKALEDTSEYNWKPFGQDGDAYEAMITSSEWMELAEREVKS